MRTHEQFMSDMDPIFDFMSGSIDEAEYRRRTAPQFSPLITVFHTCKAADRLPDGCEGCRVDLGGKLICCINQEDEE